MSPSDTIRRYTRQVGSWPGVALIAGLASLIAAANWFSISSGFAAAVGPEHALVIEASDRASMYLWVGIVLIAIGAILLRARHSPRSPWLW